MNSKKLNTILVSIIIAIILVITVGTLVVVIQKKNQSPQELLFKGKAVNLAAPADNTQISYYELGTIRVLTADTLEGDTGTVLVISPWLAYPSEDTVFYEELSRKRTVIIGILKGYFTERNKNQLLEETEPVIEEILKKQINNTLALGKISDIYFTDYIFLE